MLKKISQIASWNILSAFLNFGLNFVLARQLGNTFFGEFSLFSAKTAILGLVFIIIPSNFAVVRFQDDVKFKNIYYSFYVIGSVVFLSLLFVSYQINYLKLPVYSMFLYSWPLYFLQFFDGILQADNKLKNYFKLLFGISLVKLLAFLVAYYFKFIDDLNGVVLVIGIGNTFCMICLIIKYKKEYSLEIKFLETIDFLRSNFRSFQGYYFNSIIKNLSDNFFIFLFSGILDKSQLGLFSLFIKAQNFSFSLFRIVEAFLVNRGNNDAYYNKINEKKYSLGFVLLVVTFFVSIVYMYTLNGKMYFVESLLVSLCSFSYVSMLLVRSQLLLNYDNKSLNITIIVEMFIMLVFMFLMEILSIRSSVITCLGFVLFSSIFRVLFLKNIIKYNYVKFFQGNC